ncbi:uncharacterized protein BDV17DRAFT_266194 [Aspergillus undulatus]|uniref:uncharacterized protein n=1 Tax=Aspergillus undulatus TaxID=1810928 RepID=UPI003CCC9BF3
MLPTSNMPATTSFMVGPPMTMIRTMIVTMTTSGLIPALSARHNRRHWCPATPRAAIRIRGTGF